MTSYIQIGNNINYVNAGSTTIKAGDVVPMGKTRIAVADCQMEPGELGSLALTGVWDFPADTSAPIEFGAEVFWDNEGKKIKASKSSAEIPAGICVLAKASSAATVRVRIN